MQNDKTSKGVKPKRNAAGQSLKRSSESNCQTAAY